MKNLWVLVFTALLPAQAPATRQQAEAARSLTEAALAKGDYKQAKEQAAKCADEFSKLGDADQQIRCATLAGEAQAYLGDYSVAATTLQKAADLARDKSLDARWVTALNDLANVRFFTGNYSEAYRLYQQAAEIANRAQSNPRMDRAKQLTQANLAALYQRLGQYDRALELYRNIEKSDALSPAQHAEMLSNIGALYRRLGDPYKAIDRYRDAAKLFSTAQDRNGEIGMLTNEGLALAIDLEQYSKAVESFEKALRFAEAAGNLRESAVANLDLSEALRRTKRLADAETHAKAALAIADRLGVGEEQWGAWYTLGLIEEDRGDSGNALAHYRQAIDIFENLRSGLSSAALRAGFLSDKRAVYDGAIRVALRASPNIQEVFRDMEQVRARTLQDRSGSEGPVVLEEIARRLSPDTALLEYWTDGKESAVVWITRQGSGIRTLPLIAGDEIERLLDDLRRGSTSWKEHSRALGRKVLLALMDLPTNIRSLVIVPDGKFASIPFETLGHRGGLLQDSYTVSYLPAASLLQPISESRGWLWPWRPLFEGFADPVLPADRADATMIETSLAPLPGSKEEVEDIARVLGGVSELHIGKDNLRRYVESKSLNSAPLLHFATHAIVDPEDPDRSRLVFSSVVSGQPVDFLFAKEVYDLDLRGVRITTLAACDTETGRSIPGEGVVALSRAFLSAGAQSTVATQWRVNDRSSAQFMRSFYGGLASGQTASEALRGAKLEAARSLEPKYWAAFVLDGDASVRVPRRIPLVAFPVVLLVLATLLWFAWRPQNAEGTKGVAAPVTGSATKPTN